MKHGPAISRRLQMAAPRPADRLPPMRWIAVAAGGALGALLRYGLSGWVHRFAGGAANVTLNLVLGLGAAFAGLAPGRL